MICKIGFGDGNIVLFSSRKIEWTSCTFKNLKNIFYLLERFNNVNILGMREDFRILCLIDVSIIAIHATGGSIGDRFSKLFIVCKRLDCNSVSARLRDQVI